MKPDIKTVAEHALRTLYPSVLRSWLPGGKQHGSEYKCGDLRGGKGDSLSINVRTGRWADFASGDKGGDPVSLYAAIHGIGQAEAANDLAAQLGLVHDSSYKPRARPVREYTQAEREPVKSDFQHVVPAPESPPEKRHKHGKPSRVWAYRQITGELIGYVCRFDIGGGKKEIIPLSWGSKNDAAPAWHWKSFPEPRPLYRLPSLAALPSANVIIVEGEKAADHAAALFPQAAVVSWPGGGKAVDKADWSPLAGRKVVIWPDADEPGYSAARRIAALLPADCAVRYVVPPEGVPEGWDVADSDITPETAIAWLKQHLADTLPVWPEPEPQELDGPPPAPPMPDYYDGPSYDPEPDAPLSAEPQQSQPFILDGAPFTCLGYDKEGYYYFAHRKQQIVHLSASGHTKTNLLQLADKFYWRSEFPKGKTGDFDSDDAVDAMFRGCERAGIFNADRVRGRGAWYDAGRIAVHLGDRVLMDDVSYSPEKIPNTRFVYERADALTADLHEPLTNAEANRFVQFMDILAWEKPIYSKLAAGWCVCAHIGGVLRWRPHIWIVGRKGSGKSYVMSNIIQPVLGRNCLFVQAGSTEAGIRQRLGVDSLPVMFDEAEGEDAQAHANIQRVLGLIRQSSSETGGQIAKGTPNGKALKFMVRSCFALSSINANLVQHSDRSRVSVLELNQVNRQRPFDEITAFETALLTPDYIERFYSRAVSLAGVIRQNAATFAKAVAITLGEQRAGDQIGTLLAGAYSLYSDKLISYDDAVKWVGAQEWAEQRDEISSQNDERELWNYILQQKIRVRVDAHRDDDVPVGLLIDIASGIRIPETIRIETLTAQAAREVLLKNGLKVGRLANDAGWAVWVSNTSPHIKRWLQGTQWPVNWAKVLRRLPGAEATSAIYFGFQGSEARSVCIPLSSGELL